ncbi:MAG: Pyridoxal phosphate homeostasis protein [Hyphomicrobiales bacterium]|nr:Pyridoxal phosphate homeostasis protein [Hyphomicrobiales bacterium]
MAEPDEAPQHIATTERLKQVRAKIDRSARDAGRDPGSVHLVCVTKGQDAGQILPALQAGERIFGENRVQEAVRKWPGLRKTYPTLQLHLIGPLQTNKVNEAVELFDVIETLDRPKLATALAAALVGSARKPRLLVQVNTGLEPQKAGVSPLDADEFISFCRSSCGLEIDGLMCIPPEAEQASPHFALLAEIGRRNGLKVLSMGMSADFELGIQLGATHVRIGSAIFGTRSAP